MENGDVLGSFVQVETKLESSYYIAHKQSCASWKIKF